MGSDVLSNISCFSKSLPSKSIISNDALSGELTELPEVVSSNKDVSPHLRRLNANAKPFVATTHTCTNKHVKQESMCKQARFRAQPKAPKPQSSAALKKSWNVTYVKRQTCFCCGIPGHIARNCVAHPRKSSDNLRQKVIPKKRKTARSMTKSSDGDWNLAKKSRKPTVVTSKMSSVKSRNKSQHWQPRLMKTMVSKWKPKVVLKPYPLPKTENKSKFASYPLPKSEKRWVPKSN